MKYVLFSTLLNINIVFFARFIQGASILKINTEKIRTIEERPACFIGFKKLRFLFLCLILYNSLLIADNFELLPMTLYLTYWFPVVFWFDNFYSLEFKRAIMYSAFSSKLSTLLALFFEPHPLLWAPTCVFSAYCLYLSMWFRFCLPH